MQIQKPNRKIGLITFNSQVEIIGDGYYKIKQINSQEELSSKEKISEIVRGKHDDWLENPIKKSAITLTNQIKNFEASGQTALGPALWAGIEIAKEGKRGSKIVLCTDGEANRGLGDLQYSQSDVFYNQCAQLARENGIEISVISIEGAECKLGALIPLVEQTQGVINKLSPNDIGKDFDIILENRVIATHCQASLTLHNILKFRNEQNLQLQGSRAVKEVGNVNLYTEITFEYTQKTENEIQQQNKVDIQQQITKNLKIPFQLCIQYNTLEDIKCLRVLTQCQQTTDNLQKAEQNINLQVLSTNAKMKSATIAQKGYYRSSQAYSLNWQKYMNQKASKEQQSENKFLQQYNQLMQDTNSMMQQQINFEKMSGQWQGGKSDKFLSTKRQQTNNDRMHIQFQRNNHMSMKQRNSVGYKNNY